MSKEIELLEGQILFNMSYDTNHGLSVKIVTKNYSEQFNNIGDRYLDNVLASLKNFISSEISYLIVQAKAKEDYYNDSQKVFKNLKKMKR